ncbi:arylsulfatase [Sphingomonas montanisoli]|uniref:Arylsulfatase n=1 Tax=Sphingomonas montanisoli TaxID=2606412 RepID=A0A5D9C1S4_9SPHN|nr:arylsulfatase [Sphingomonas montanisoli]TZG25818.1 arylsulfatase [Sphingomonas montanisoli]
MPQRLFGIARLTLVLLSATALAAQAGAQTANGRTPVESPPPSWPQEVRAPNGAPNIIVIMTDDVGFGASTSFGGPVPTPTFDRIGREGARYNRFHTTAICSPTRASLLTGRNPQEVGMGYVANWATGYEGYNSVIPKSAGTIAQILKANGYNTAMFGKGHITPEWEMSATGPFDRWPTGLGFEYYYGFIGADTSGFEPSLVENTRQVTPPANSDYILDRDLADRTVRWIGEHEATQPDKPFFIYLAPGTAHAPNHAPKEWIERFKGQFDQGWDVLRAQIVARQKKLGVIPAAAADAPRPETLPRWKSLMPGQKRLYARYMEAYAGSLAFADDQIGRVLDAVRDSGQADNTVIVYIQGDNGASAEGSFNGLLYEQSALSGAREDTAYAQAHINEIGTKAAYNLNPGGWGWAMNAPYPWSKRYGSHFGGTRNAMTVMWPGHIKDPGKLRSQFLHVSDVMPTLLEVAGIRAPAELGGIRQQPITGISFAYTLNDPGAAPRRTQQVFAMSQNLAIYKDGWVAATAPMVTPWEKTRPKPIPLEQRQWQLYDIEKDFSEAHDIAARHPAKLAELKDIFWAEAAKAKMLPIHASEGGQEGRPDVSEGRTSFVYTQPVTEIPETGAPPTVGRSFRIAAEIDVPAGGARGVLAAHGGRFGGYSLFIDGEGRPCFTYRFTPEYVTRIVGATPLASGTHRLLLDLRLDREEKTSGGNATLSVDGAAAGNGRIERTFALIVSHTEGFSVGSDPITPVDDAYQSRTSAFTGRIGRIEITNPR